MLTIGTFISTFKYLERASWATLRRRLLEENRHGSSNTDNSREQECLRVTQIRKYRHFEKINVPLDSNVSERERRSFRQLIQATFHLYFTPVGYAFGQKEYRLPKSRMCRGYIHGLWYGSKHFWDWARVQKDSKPTSAHQETQIRTRCDLDPYNFQSLV